MVNPQNCIDMVHTENLVLVDTKRRVRGFMTRHQKEDIKRLIEDINF
jgi:protein SCO1/2